MAVTLFDKGRVKTTQIKNRTLRALYKAYIKRDTSKTGAFSFNRSVFKSGGLNIR